MATAPATFGAEERILMAAPFQYTDSEEAVNLHATDIDRLYSSCLQRLHRLDRRRLVRQEGALAFDIDGPRPRGPSAALRISSPALDPTDGGEKMRRQILRAFGVRDGGPALLSGRRRRGGHRSVAAPGDQYRQRGGRNAPDSGET